MDDLTKCKSKLVKLRLYVEYLAGPGLYREINLGFRALSPPLFRVNTTSRFCSSPESLHPKMEWPELEFIATFTF